MNGREKLDPGLMRDVSPLPGKEGTGLPAAASADAPSPLSTTPIQRVGQGSEGEMRLPAPTTSELPMAPTDRTTFENVARDPKKRKKKRRELKPIAKKHPEFELAYDMMLGIRTVVGRGLGGFTESVVDETSLSSRPSESIHRDYPEDGAFGYNLQYDRFTEKLYYRFPKIGSMRTPAHVMKDFKFKDYCPDIFKDLRDMFDVDPAQYLIDICGDFELLEFISNSKSGEFFFFTHNQRFMVKTMTKSESKLLRKVMPAYYSYISKQPHSLLTKFFGMHRVKPHKRKPIYFLIMSSVFWSECEVHKIYDLKGSTHGRKASKKDVVKKDLDFLNDGTYLRVGPGKAKMFKEQLRRDCEFLRKQNIMDYSLLIGIHYRDRRNASPSHTATSTEFLPLDKTISKPGSSPNLGDADSGADVTSASLIHLEPSRPSPPEKKQQASPDRYDTLPKSAGSSPIKPRHNAVRSELPKVLRPETGTLKKRTSRSVPQSPRHPAPSSSNTTALTKSFSHPESLFHQPDKKFQPRSSHLSHPNPPTMKKNYRTTRPANFQYLPPPLSTDRAYSQPQDRAPGSPRKRPMSPAFSDDPEEERATSPRPPSSTNPFTEHFGGMCFRDENGELGNEVYFTGVIDILQRFNKRKKVESFFKSLTKDTKLISAAPPEVYAKRLLNFIEDRII